MTRAATVIAVIALAGAAVVYSAAAGPGDEAVRAIELPQYQSNLPNGPGQQAFAAACLSCHSASYVTMQPTMPAAKWEETVRKMIKVYAAPMTEEQVPQVVAYIMATKEAGATASWESGAAAPARVRTIKPAPGDRERGAVLFAQNCASCHGPRGAGDGPTAATQLPPPSDLTAALYTPQLLADAICNGVRATAMPAYPTLSDDDVRALVTHTRQLSATASQGEKPARPTDEAKRLFAQNCVTCHGANGAGDGIAAPASPRPPANFRLKQPSAAQAAKIIADGVPGTTMPQWRTKLTDPQRQLLVDYVRSLYVEPQPAP
jgi:mono/diheme cytochrome c family protein